MHRVRQVSSDERREVKTRTTRYTILLTDEDVRRVERIMRMYLHDSLRSSIRYAIRRQAKRGRATQKELASCKRPVTRAEGGHLVAIPMTVLDREALKAIMRANDVGCGAPAVRLAIRTEVRSVRR